jgi:hypothetical protein
MTSSFSVPTMTSLPSVPTIVAGLPRQVGVAVDEAEAPPPPDASAATAARQRSLRE